MDISRAVKNTSIFYWNQGKDPVIKTFKRGGEFIKIHKNEQISSNEWMNRHHAIVMTDNDVVVKFYSHEEKTYKSLKPSALKVWYGQDKAYDKNGRWIEKGKDSGEYYGMAEFWLNSSDRNKFDGEVFFPTPGKIEVDSEKFPYDEKSLNTYLGLAVKPKEGNVSILLEFIKAIISNGDDSIYTYIVCWIARLAQRPDLPAETAILIKSIQGTGKGTLFEKIIAKWFGAHRRLNLPSSNSLGR